MKFLLRLMVVLLPWILRRHVLRVVYGYRIHPTARIGWSWVFPERLILEEGARIGHLNAVIRLHRLELGRGAMIGRSNWITGFPRGASRHFAHLPNRDPSLVMGAQSAVTKQHFLDCTERITIGAFTTVGGQGSQIMTHEIDLQGNRQDAAPITLGEYCFVGTAVVILSGAQLPSKSVLGAKALLNKTYTASGWLYAGVPAHPIHALPADAAYFQRTTGWVW